MQYVLAGIADDRCPSDIVNAVEVFQVIHWVVNTWE